MAGIQNAEKLIKENKDYGKVIECGKYQDGTKIDFYYKISLNHGNIDVVDYGSDVRVANNIELGDMVKLTILDEVSAMWLKEGESFSDKLVRDDKEYGIGRIENTKKDQKVEEQEYKLLKEIEERVRKLEKIKGDKLKAIEPYYGDIIVDGGETVGTKLLLYYSKDAKNDSNDELEELEDEEIESEYEAEHLINLSGLIDEEFFRIETDSRKVIEKILPLMDINEGEEENIDLDFKDFSALKTLSLSKILERAKSLTDERIKKSSYDENIHGSISKRFDLNNLLDYENKDKIFKYFLRFGELTTNEVLRPILARNRMLFEDVDMFKKYLKNE